MKQVKAVIFDQDGLMFDTEKLAADAWNIVGKKYGIQVDEEFLRDLRGTKPDRVQKAFTKRFGTEIDYEAFREEKRSYSYRWIDENGVPVKKGLKELLAYLKEQGIPCAVATASSSQWTQRNVKEAGISEFFKAYIYGDMVKEAKPDPAIFLLAAETLGEKPENCMVLEDSFNGIRAAAAGGFIPVMVPDLAAPTPELKSLLAAECESLLDVISLLEQRKEMNGCG